MSAPKRFDFSKPTSAQEETGFRTVGGEQAYYVLHRAAAPRAQILLAGHFATERPVSYPAWMRWARFLAEHGITALRFDYRGCGESTGKFQEFTIGSWLQDCQSWYDFLLAAQPRLPVVLCGIGMGGLLASHLFRQGLGASMLLWSPSQTGAETLREVFLRQMASDMANPTAGRPKGWMDYRATLEAGKPINAAGYTLSPALWSDAVSLKLILPAEAQTEGVDKGRAWKVCKLGRTEVPLVAGIGVWQLLNPGQRMRRAPLNPAMDQFFQENLDWIEHNMLTRRT